VRERESVANEGEIARRQRGCDCARRASNNDVATAGCRARAGDLFTSHVNVEVRCGRELK
jgi:hypothetical protein